MATFVETVVSGAGAGALDALLALGIVLIFRLTGVLNFAQAATGTAAGYVCYWASVGHSVWQGVVAALLAGAVLGQGTGILVSGIAARNGTVGAAVATLAVAVLLEQVVRLLWGTTAGLFPQLVPGGAITIGTVTIPDIFLASCAIAAGIGLGLGYMLQTTRVGRMMRAMADDAEQARLCGARVTALSMLAWAVAGCLAAVAALLSAQIVFDPSYMDPYFVGALIAAVLGGLRRMWAAFAGAIGVEVSRNLLQAYAPASLLPYTQTILVCLLILVLLLAPRTWISGAARRRV